ncbi:MAG: hypothetical protein KDD69_11260, partial [Bdellovibrionales bacterium]|nr:hypothetical protein [Bdellovibrionales bacterium]
VHALDSSDGAAARAITDQWPEDFFESVSRGVYANARGNARELLGVLVKNGTAMAFTTAFGATDLYVYTFKKREGVWKIRRESFDELGTWRAVLAAF